MPAEVTLRNFRPDDAEAVHRWFNDERVTADLVGSRDSFTLENAAAWVERAIDTSEDRKWAITIDGDDTAVGFVALFGLGRQLGPELAVLIGDPSAWGKGVAREAERQACNHAFSDYDAHRIHAEIPATNGAAQKVVTFLGFRCEGTMKAAIRRGDERIDNQVWGLLPEDFTGWELAELIADRGAAAESDDLFRSRDFLGAEGVTHTLRIESPERTALVPLIVRGIEGSDGLDAVSPYGYPGATVNGTGSAPAVADVDWSRTGLVSVFGRERLAGEPWLANPAERSRVLVHDPAAERRVRPRLAEQVRANEREGWTVETIPGSDSAPADRDAFAVAYEQTMRRAEAADRYFFDHGYFDAVLSFERAWLVVARRGGEVGAAAIAATSDSILHYYLGGTADAARAASPFKNVVTAMLDLADEVGLPLNLGGGVKPGDGLEEFKRGFANADLPFHAQEVVCDRVTYDELTAGREAGGYFPAYRAS